MWTKILIIAFCVLFPYQAFGANYYVRSGATGSNDGSDWTNARTSLPTTLTRGNVYYIAGGSYAGRTFNTAASGSTLITIKGATVADHGTDTGWNASYAVSSTQATWTSSITFNSPYWVFDGVVGSMSKTATDYGFSFGTNMSGVFWIGTSGSTTITISHVYARATASDVEKLFVQNTYGGSTSNLTVSHCLLDRWQNGVMARGNMTNLLWEYNMCLNGSSTSSNHGEWINPNSGTMTNATIRYNWFEGYSGTLQTGTIVANNRNNESPLIYGNVFKDVYVGNGVITGTSAGNMNNARVYNNTLTGCIVYEAGQGSPIGGTGQGSGNIAWNNIIANGSADNASGWSYDYNAYYNTTNSPSETHKQTLGSNPFINLAGDNLRLLYATNAGSSLDSPYNMDMDGNARGSDETWDRGAYEYVSGAGDTTPPTITSVNSNKANGTYTVGEVIDIDVTFSEAVTSTGNVTVTLETGTTDRTCTFTISNSTAGTCNYTVQAGDTSSDLTTNSISGTIADQSDNAMVNFTPTTTLGANKALVIDTTAPTIISVNSDKANGAYGAGEIIDIDVTFSEAVTSTGDMTVTLETGGTDRTCTFQITNNTVGTCNYTIVDGDISSDLTVNTISGTIADQAGNAMTNFTPNTNLAANKALIVDTTIPVVSAFDLPATSVSRTVSINSFACTDTGGSGVSAYCVTTSKDYAGCSWVASPPTTIIFGSPDGPRSGYGWCRDVALNVSGSGYDTIVIDITPPTVSEFTLPATSNSLTVSISSFTADDNIELSSYCVNESSTPPTSETCLGSGWEASAQSSYTFSATGVNTLWAWVKDALGNIGPTTLASDSVDIDSVAPVISGILPTGFQRCTGHPTTLSLEATTDENATCKYSVSNTTYDLMETTFSTTGTTSHSTSVFGYCGISYTYYLRCKDGLDNKNLSSSTATFFMDKRTIFH